MAAEIPEEVVCTFEGVDDVTPTMMHLGRSFVLLGANIGMIAKALGIHNAALDKAIQGILLVGHVMRALNAAMVIYNTLKELMIGLEVAHTAALTQQQIAYLFMIARLGEATAAQTGFNMAKAIAIALEGPPGWAWLAGAAVAAGAFGAAVGYGAGGGFSGSHTPGETTNVTVNVANLSTKRDVEEMFYEAGTVVHRMKRDLRRPGGY